MIKTLPGSDIVVKMKPKVWSFTPQKAPFECNFKKSRNLETVIGANKTLKWKKIVDTNLYSVTQMDGKQPLMTTTHLHGTRYHTLPHFFNTKTTL
jgi:hypothetical protein